jgi:PAS domain S-box-containing protein
VTAERSAPNLPSGKALRAAIVVGLSAIVLLGTLAVVFASRVTNQLNARVEAITAEELPAAMALADLRSQVLLVRGAAVGAAAGRPEAIERLEKEIGQLRGLMAQLEGAGRAGAAVNPVTSALREQIERYIPVVREVAGASASHRSDPRWWHAVDARLASVETHLMPLTRSHAEWYARQVHLGVARSRSASASELRQLGVFGGIAAAAAGAILLLVLRWMERDRRAVHAAFEAVRRQQEESSRLSLAVNRSTNSVIICDSQGRIEWCNEGFTRITGYSIDEARGRTPGSLLQGPESDPAVVGRMRVALREGRGFREEILNYRKDRQAYWIQVDCQPLNDGLGRITGFMAIESDISERKRLQLELEATAARLVTATQAAGVGIWDLDLTNDAVVWDDTMRQLHGIPEGAPLPSVEVLRERIHPEDREIVRSQAAQALEGHSGFRSDVRIQRMDGQWRHLHLSAAVMLGADGRPVRLIGTAIDMTDRVNTQRALLESRSRLAVFADHAPAAVAMFDTEMKYLLCTRRWLSDYGMEGESVIGRSHYEVFPEIPRRWREVHARCLGGRIETCEEDPFERCDGRVQWLRWEARPWYTATGAVGGVLMMTEDITQQRQSREILRIAQVQAEAASRAKSEFLANMSHELRTPMTAILGYVDLLNEASRDEAVFAEHIGTIRRNADHLLTIINDVLDLSKIEAGKMTAEIVACSPARIAAEVVELHRARARECGLLLGLRVEGEIPAEIRTDPTRLRQILMNLVGNAVKFTERGEVTLLMSLEVEKEPRLRFRVTDTGIGIEPDRLQSLFQPFTQADTSVTRRFGGTGLGLAICRRLAMLLGGELSAKSESGVGSEFSVTIATGRLDGVAMVTGAPSVAGTEMSGPEADVAPRLNGKILLVEDGVDNQRLIAHHLRRAGAQVEISGNGQRAVERLCAGGNLHGELVSPGEFALVLMDMQMPEMDGYAATRMLRAKGYGGAIVALTAHAMTGDREACLTAGCDDYLTKPIDARAMVAMCSQWMAKGKSENAQAGASGGLRG